VIRSWSHQNDTPADLSKHFHDYRVVRTPEVSPGASRAGDRRELADCVPGVLVSGPCERVRVNISWREIQMESCRFAHVPGWRRGIWVLGKAVTGAVLESVRDHERNV
jgi:hypothetical protein